MVRREWRNLNGEWGFEVDAGDSGLERGLLNRELDGAILVPFAPESRLSGLGIVDFMPAVWYRREVRVPAAWSGQRVLLHFGAVDHDATVWVNGIEVARHRGGYSPFTADLTDAAIPGDVATIVVRARDSRTAPQARGKQATKYANSDCYYTRTTGIWQTVWMEPVPQTYLGRPRITPHVATSSLTVGIRVSGNAPGWSVRATVSSDGTDIASVTARADIDLTPTVHIAIPDQHLRLWEPGAAFLYDVLVELVDESGEVVDSIRSYAGMRSVAIDGTRVLINGRAVFQRLVLDQGYYEDGIMTAPDDAALVRDIELALEAGFNGARLHQKVFEERYLYHADRLGYLVWGEFADWGVEGRGPLNDHQRLPASFVGQWLEVLERDVSHPSIIGWCPLNETWQALADEITDLDDVMLAMFLATKQADPSRPVLDSSGYSHRIRASDIYDAHDYEQDPEVLRAHHEGLAEGRPFVNTYDGHTISTSYAGQPYFVSEFGGIWWNPDLAHAVDGGDASASWGYGQRVRDEEEFHRRFAALATVLLDDPAMFGYCYTQLTDVFQEHNGIYRFDRSSKFDVARIRRVQERPAATEVPDGRAHSAAS